ncbi:cytochrome P450 family 71 subfamily B polypeptide 2 [Euphorbia peplus]|nr:putative cytochrome P450 monooxygenase [Euphorbia peplus]WCJ37099.1 cytochrome P450 family 71 subfamily B polypeptide 2 [Euphorbia peplus]
MDLHITSFSFLTTFFIFISIALKLWKRPSKNLPPGPRKLPLIGNIHQLATDLPHRRLTELAKTYGPVMHIQIGQIPAVIISSAELAKKVLKTEELMFLERPFLLAADIMLYNRTGITFAPYGDYWREMKKIVTLEVLTAKRVKSFRSIREKEVSNFVQYLHSKGGSPVDLTSELLGLTNSIIAISTTGKKCKKQDEIIGVIADAIEAAGGFSIAEAFPSFGLLPKITGMSSLLRRIHQKADEILEEIINEHKAIRATLKSKIESDNILDVLLDIQEHGELQFNLTTDNIKAMTLEMLGAATDTSSVTTQWAISELMKNPSVMKKAQEEIRRVCRGKTTVDEEDIRELKYLKLIIKETFRLHPPVPLIPRECLGTCQLNGYVIYPKTRVLVNAGAIGKDPKIWDDPERFYPERFVDSSIEFKGNDFELIPFGAGKRICPGITMVMANVELMIAHMLYHFDWKMPDEAKSESIDMSESFGLAIKRKTNLILVPIPYEPIVEGI